MAQPTNRRLVTEAALEARLAAVTYDSGARNITASVNPAEGMTAGVVSLRRLGAVVQLDLDALVFTMAAGSKVTPIVRLGQPLLPAGFRPSRTLFFPSARRDLPETHGGVRIDANGYVYLYQVSELATNSTSTAYYRASAVFMTTQTPPITPPGDPA